MVVRAIEQLRQPQPRIRVDEKLGALDEHALGFFAPVRALEPLRNDDPVGQIVRHGLHRLAPEPGGFFGAPRLVIELCHVLEHQRLVREHLLNRVELLVGAFEFLQPVVEGDEREPALRRRRRILRGGGLLQPEVALLGLVAASEILQDGRAQQQRRVVVGQHRDGALGVDQRLFLLARRKVGATADVDGLRALRIERQHAVRASDSVLVRIGLQIGGGEQHRRVGGKAAARHAQHTIERVDGARGIVGLDQREAQQLVGVGVVRRGLQDLVQRVDRLAKLAGVLQSAGVVEAAFERALTGAEGEREHDEREPGGEGTRQAGERSTRRADEGKGTMHACRSLPKRTRTIRNDLA